MSQCYDHSYDLVKFIIKAPTRQHCLLQYDGIYLFGFNELQRIINSYTF